MRPRLWSARVILPPALVVVAWSALVWWPVHSQSNADRALLARLEAAQATTVADVASLKRASDLTEDYERDLARFAELVPPELGVDEVLRRFDRLAAANGFRLELVSPAAVVDPSTGGPVLPPSVSALSISLAGVGSYRSAVGFIDALQSDNRLVAIDSMSFTTTGDAADEIVVDLVCRIFTTASISAIEGDTT